MSKSTCSATHFCGFDPAKLVVFLREKFPHDTAKSVAAALNISPRNVENWLALRASPGFLTTGAMIDRWGAEFLVAVMSSPPGWAREAVAREEFAELERRRAVLKSRLRRDD
ncbi:hypothetical protein QM467_04625 [Rhodoblastus sp. 17X3]|uniref:hypothetical protein n=1 Tax=Rhodoblastus sp. 17X3 TaxID=3047026 RepID=UPI0024B758AF|nr:hypothetical protein [Rhodoblastus sp. 17X3]MDI9847344.1 hypothetical protein [Rhodoblastus sp. 17X3]